MTITIDLHLLGYKLSSSGRAFIRVHELAFELGVSPRTAGRILSKLAELGYLIKWSKGLYLIKRRIYYVEPVELRKKDFV